MNNRYRQKMKYWSRHQFNITVTLSLKDVIIDTPIWVARWVNDDE